MMQATTISKDISLELDGGVRTRAWLAQPDVDQPVGGVLLLHEISGVNFHLRSVAEYFAGLGYITLAPNLFGRLDEQAENDYSKEGLARALALLERYDDMAGVRDLTTIVKAFRATAGCSGKIAAVGYCFGGRMAYLAGAYCGVDAVAGFYPTWVERYLDLADKIQCPMSLHFPERDALEAPDATSKVVSRFADRSDVELFIYAGAGHAFDSDASRSVYRRFASQLANSRVALFLNRTIGPGK